MDHFSCFFGRCIYLTVWTRNRSNIDFQVLVIKGLKESLNDFIQLQKDSVPVGCAKSISLDVVDDRKKAFLKREKSASEDTIMKMGKEEKLSIHAKQ